jgi:hypothetical protein
MAQSRRAARVAALDEKQRSVLAPVPHDLADPGAVVSEKRIGPNPLGWGPKGRWFKSSRPDLAVAHHLGSLC